MDFILSLIKHNKSLRNTFNIGSDKKDISIKDLAKIIIKLSKKKIKIKKENDVLGSPKRRLPAVSKAISLTGYKYQHTLEKGLENVLKS